MQTAAILLSLGALGGLTLAAIRISSGRNPPLWMAMGHGAVVAAGLGLLIYTAMNSTVTLFAQIALGIFGLAVLGGVTLLAGFHLRSRTLPVPLVLGHGLIAISGVVLLWLGVLGRG
jgi:hypothetical protein